MDEFKIEKGVPIPIAEAGRRTSALSKALSRMEINDSVFCTGLAPSTVHQRAKRVLGTGNYACRKEGDGHRIWRTK